MIKEQQVLTIQKTVQKSISELVECGTKATEIRLSAACRIRDPIANSDDATESIKLAVLRSNRFHAPKSLKDAPKVELSSEDRVYANPTTTR